MTIGQIIEEKVCFYFHTVRSIGCWRDTGRRAIPPMDGRNVLVKGSYKKRADAILKCALIAMKYRWRVFAIQDGGWCATGPRAHRTYRKYGRSNKCRNGKGGPWANDVYGISGEFSLAYFYVSLDVLWSGFDCFVREPIFVDNLPKRLNKLHGHPLLNSKNCGYFKVFSVAGSSQNCPDDG